MRFLAQGCGRRLRCRAWAGVAVARMGALLVMLIPVVVADRDFYRARLARILADFCDGGLAGGHIDRYFRLPRQSQGVGDGEDIDDFLGDGTFDRG